MDYNHISNFLEKFKKIVFEKEEIYNIISSIIFKYTKKSIDIKLIKIKNTTIYVQSSPILKNEILIYKREILQDLKKLVNSRIFLDIK